MTVLQESTRKDIERFNAFLQGRVKILRNEFIEFDLAFLISMNNLCVIIYKTLVELRLSSELDDEYDFHGHRMCRRLKGVRVAVDSLVRELEGPAPRVGG